jgi:hypothetical protein
MSSVAFKEPVKIRFQALDPDTQNDVTCTEARGKLYYQNCPNLAIPEAFRGIEAIHVHVQ